MLDNTVKVTTLTSIGQPHIDFIFGTSTLSNFPPQSPFLNPPVNSDIGFAANPFVLGWNYQSFGVWDSVDTAGNRSIFVATFGAPTPGSAVPTTGAATFAGKLGGLYISPAGQGSVAFADLTVNANFSTRSLGFASTGTITTRDLATTTAASNLNLSGTLTYSPSSSQFAGTLVNAGGTMSGQSTGKFYGPSAQELGGIFTLRSPTTSETFAGGYGAKR